MGLVSPPPADVPGVWYDEAAAEAACEFFPEHLVLTLGKWAGQPFHLAEYQQRDIIRPLFGWKRASGTRWYRRCIVWIPRKNGKTELAAGVSHICLVGDAEVGGEGYAIARDEEQAKIVFNRATTMVQWSPTLGEELETFKTAIYCPALNASFKPLTGIAKGKHGLAMSFLIGDEVHEWKDDELYNFVHQSSGNREQPLEFLISTAGQRSGFGWELWKHCLAVLAGEAEDPETLIVIYAADPEDDWTEPATWYKANPNLGVSPTIEYMERECRDAQQLPRKENDFKRYHLNLWTEQATRWLPIIKWDVCGWPEPDADYEAAMASALAAGERLSAEMLSARRSNTRWKQLPDAMRGRTCTVGLDLSSVNDLTCAAYVFEPEYEEDNGIYTIIPRFFIPEGAVAERVRADKVPYDRWIAEGALLTTPGNAVDQEAVYEAVLRDAEQFFMRAMGIDRWNAGWLSNKLMAEDFDVKGFGQGFGSMSAPSKELERLMLLELLDHGGHPVLRWCINNTAVVTDDAGNIKPSKKASSEKIDGTVATLIALGVSLGVEPEEESGYESHGLREVVITT